MPGPTARSAGGAKRASRGRRVQRRRRRGSRRRRPADGAHPPRDLAVIGHDDTPLASMFEPRLSTISVNTVGLGRYLAGLALSAVENRPLPPAGPELRVALVPRASTASLVTPTRQIQDHLPRHRRPEHRLEHVFVSSPVAREENGRRARSNSAESGRGAALTALTAPVNRIPDAEQAIRNPRSTGVVGRTRT